MFPLSWFEFAVGSATVTAINLFIIVWLTRAHRLSARLLAETEREALNSKIETLQRELVELRAKRAPPAQPQTGGSAYACAIEMARAGSDVNLIASSCDLTRGEAELIVALHRSGISST